MLELAFSVSAKTFIGEHIGVVGSTSELGNWNPHCCLVLKSKKGLWEGSIHMVHPQSKIEFKLIKMRENGETEWEHLPNNSNRKFKPKFSTQLHLIWNQASGRINSISNDSFKLQGLPAAMLKKTSEAENQSKTPKLFNNFKLKPKLKVSEQFDPYSKARDQESEEQNEEQFLLVRRKMNQNININTKDLEEIYYKNSSIQILAGLLQKVKIYVISKDLQQQYEMHQSLQAQLNLLPPNYLARWITQDCFEESPTSGIKKGLKKRGSLFEIGYQQLYLQNLYSKTSYFVILQIQVAIFLSKMLQKVSCCLFLPSSKFNEVIENLSKLSHVDLICFQSVEANKAFYDYLMKHGQQVKEKESQFDIKSIENPSIYSMVEELQTLKYSQAETIHNLECINIKQLTAILAKPNHLALIDYSIIEQHSEIMQKIKIKPSNSMFLILADKKIPMHKLDQLSAKNNIFVYDDFEKIRLQGKDYFPLRSFREIIQQLKMKAKIYKDDHGGQIVQRQSSLIYFLPEGKQEIASKIEIECKKLVAIFGFVKVSRKGIRVKLSWNLSKEIRLVRTICELKYVNNGLLGEFSLIAQKMNFKQLKEEIGILIELMPKLFVDGKNTQVHDYQVASYQKKQEK